MSRYRAALAGCGGAGPTQPGTGPPTATPNTATLLSTVEDAAPPTVNRTRARAIFAAAAKLLPQV